MLETTTFKGWANWETWQIALWIDHEVKPPIYHKLKLQFLDSTPTLTSATVRDFCLDLFPNGTPDMHDPSEMHPIDWEQIADRWTTEKKVRGG